MTDKLTIFIGAKDQFSKTFAKLNSVMGPLKGIAIAGGAAFAGLSAAIIANTKAVAADYDRVQKFSDQIGISTEALSEYRHVAELSGVSNEALFKAFRNLSKVTSEAAKGTGIAKDSLVALRLDIQALNNMSPDKRFEAVAEALSKVKNQTDKVRIAYELFGGRGTELLQTMKAGAAGIREMREEAAHFGLTIRADAGMQAAAFNDSVTRLTGSIRGVRNMMAESWMPVFTVLNNRIAEFIAGNRVLIGQKAEEYLGKVFIMLNEIKEALPTIIQRYQEWSDKLNRVNDAIGKAGRWVHKFFGGTAYDAEEAAVEMERNVHLMNMALGNIGNVDTGTTKGFFDKIREEYKALLADIRTQSDMTVAAPQVAGAGSIDVSASMAPSTQKYQEAADQVAEAHRNFLTEWRAREEENMLQFDIWRVQDVYGAQEAAESKLEATKGLLAGTQKLSSAFGAKAFRLQQGLSITQATMSAFEAYNKNLAAYPGPIGIAFAKAALALGLAQVGVIAAQKPPALHTGLDFVPKEQQYLLDRGERVVSADQNRDLTEFLNQGGFGNVTIERLEIRAFENVTTAQSLMDMDSRDVEEVFEEKFIPAIQNLAGAGIKAG